MSVLPFSTYQCCSLSEGYIPADKCTSSVWSQITASLSGIRSIFSANKKVSDGLKKFTLKLVTPATERLGWDFKPDEDFLTSQLRALLIATAGLAGHQRYVRQNPAVALC